MSKGCYQGLPWKGHLFVVGFGLCVFLGSAETRKGPYDWLTYDSFDEVNDRINAVNAQNCKWKPATELRLPADTVAQQPKFNRLLSYIVYPNRTKLLHAHNMALNRAFFYSYIFQKLNETEHFFLQPGLLYYYFSTAADISANTNNINGSGIFFGGNGSYANWYRFLPFNRTVPRFAPRAYRVDDFIEPTNWFREPTNNTINIIDYGAGPGSNYSDKAYKINQWYDLFLPDDWRKKGLDSVRKFTYDIGIKYSDETGKFTKDEYVRKTMFGPPSPGQKETEYLPVLFTEPYFDCGRSNRWIVSAVAPVVDILPRYWDWFYFRRNTYVAVTTMDMDFLSIDFNPCPTSVGNQLPNYFRNISRCKPTTTCEPLYGWGFRRGGYQCLCKPGYRYPPWQYGPFQGIEIESATEDEYTNGFDCIAIELRQASPVVRSNKTSGIPSVQFNFAGRNKRSSNLDEVADLGIGFFDRPLMARKTDRAARFTDPEVLQSRILNKKLRLLRMANLKEGMITVVKNGSTTKKRALVPRVSHPFHLDVRTNRKIQFVPRHKGDTAYNKRTRRTFDHRRYDRMMSIFNHKTSINKDNCKNFKLEELQLLGDVGYNVEEVFSNQARTALRLSHFLSNFLQNFEKFEESYNLKRDRPLNVEQIFGEVLANTMGDLKIKGSGVFFDIDKFQGPDLKIRQFFGPYAWRYEEASSDGETDSEVVNFHFRAIDYAGVPETYIEEPWFKNVKERWQFNTCGLEKFREKLMIRSDMRGHGNLMDFMLFPVYYKAPREDDGIWSAPYFDCDGYVNDWVITYSVPFFGLNSVTTGIEFKGVVIVDVKLDELDINQCPQEYFVPNAFKDTARCHYESTYCVHLAGNKFVRGSYKCDCKVGYEYPYNDNATYFDGQTVEEEYRKKMAGDKQNRYDHLQCRISVSSRTVVNTLITLTVIGLWPLLA